MTAILDGLIATGATFEAVADEASSLGYRLKERRVRPPVAGSIFVDQTGLLHRVRYRCLGWVISCLLYTSPSPRDGLLSRMPSSA